MRTPMRVGATVLIITRRDEMIRAWFPTTIWAATCAAVLTIGQVAAADDAACDKSCDSGCDAAGCDADGCNADGCGLLGGRGSKNGCGRRIAGWDRSYNCGCNGSYNYPVPPLYTYHWPGLYKQQLMTDYHSPWRFPAIKPYTDEPVAKDATGADDANRRSNLKTLPVGYRTARGIKRQGERSVSDLVKQMYR